MSDAEVVSPCSIVYLHISDLYLEVEIARIVLDVDQMKQLGSTLGTGFKHLFQNNGCVTRKEITLLPLIGLIRLDVYVLLTKRTYIIDWIGDD